MCSIKCSSFVTPLQNSRIADVTCSCWTAFAFYFKIFPHCRHFFSTGSLKYCKAHVWVLLQIVFWCKKKKQQQKSLGSMFKIADPQSVKKMPISHIPIPASPVSSWHHPTNSHKMTPNTLAQISQRRVTCFDRTTAPTTPSSLTLGQIVS